jgi:ureidoglycolate lyase
MTILHPEPLTKAGFAPFGDVIEADGKAPLTINQGFALRFDDLATIDVNREGGRVKTSLFVAQSRPQPIVIDLMERHPLGSQLFYPLQNKPWLVLVCNDPKKPESFRAFSATGQQGVNYHPNVWHFPLLVTDSDSRFIVVDRKGPGNNLEEVSLDQRLSLMVALDVDHMSGIY